ncbi:hypothetical protein JXL83_01125 [candidate division WOR-3 bacterium]|nr:hypothetical protein [candidate division WOR-3 bacterium]
MNKIILIYDTWTRNTEKIAKIVSATAECVIFKVDDSPKDLSGYDLILVGSPVMRASPTKKILNFLEDFQAPPYFALFLTYGMPLWGQISSIICFRKMRKTLTKKRSTHLESFSCPGFHSKYKTYLKRPDERDFRNAISFAKSVIIKFTRISGHNNKK